MKLNYEFILGLIGSMIGVAISLFAMLLGYIDNPGPVLDSIDGKVPMNPISVIGLKTLGFSVLGVLGAIFIKTRKLFGSLMFLTAAIGGYMIISTLYIVPCIFFILSCCMTIYQSRAETKESSGDTCKKTKDVI